MICYGDIWRSYIGSKYSFIMWLIFRGRLPTKDRLDFLNIDPCCVFCVGRHESLRHLFWECPFVNLVWRKIKNWAKWVSRLKTILRSFREIKRDRSCGKIEKKGRTVCLLISVYHVWRVRNEAIIGAKRYTVDEVVRRIKIDAFRFIHIIDDTNSLGWY